MKTGCFRGLRGQGQRTAKTQQTCSQTTRSTKLTYAPRGTPTVVSNLRLLTPRFANSNQIQTLSLSSFSRFRCLLSDKNSRPSCILSPAHLEISALHRAEVVSLL